MRRWFWVLFFISCAAAAEASLFDEQDKDAESQLVMGVAKDRKVTKVENVRNIELAEDYLLQKMDRLDRKLRRMGKRVEKLESEVKELRSRVI